MRVINSNKMNKRKKRNPILRCFHKCIVTRRQEKREKTKRKISQEKQEENLKQREPNTRGNMPEIPTPRCHPTIYLPLFSMRLDSRSLEQHIHHPSAVVAAAAAVAGLLPVELSIGSSPETKGGAMPLRH